MNNESNEIDAAAKCSQDATAAQPKFVWRHTMDDGMMPFINMHSGYIEKPQSGFKGNDGDNPQISEKDMLIENMNKFYDPTSLKVQYFDDKIKQAFELNKVLYATDIKQFVQLKKFDEEKQTYACKPLKAQDKEDAKDIAEVHVKQDDLSETVEVNVRRINITAISDAGVGDLDLKGDTATLRVRIDDPISNIVEMMDAISDDIGGGHLLFKGKLQNDTDLTFVKLQAGNDAMFMLASAAGGSSGKCKKWWRFKNPLTNCTWHWSDNTDSLCFVPKRDITWYGFGCYTARNDNADLAVECRWMLDDADNITQDWTKTTHENATANQETQTHDVFLTQFGAKPIKVKAGQKIYLCTRSSVGRMNVNYGDQGSDYATIENQDLDFDVEHSKWDNNNTNVSRGMFPYILYSSDL